jgi:hypothetical protein
MDVESVIREKRVLRDRLRHEHGVTILTLL